MKTILITGANRGIGIEFVKQCLADNWKVIACCRKPEEAHELKAFSKSANFSLHKLDVCKHSEIKKLATELKDTKIDILLNNAGVYGDASTLAHIDPDDWLHTLRINTIAPLIIAQALQDQVAASELKIIANMSSLMGSIADNTQGEHYTYRSSKAALNAVTKSLSIDVKKQKITAIVLHPGWVQTDMGGKNAPLTAGESVKGLLNVLNKVTLTDSGKFFDYKHRELPW